MANRRKKFFDLFALAVRTGHFLVSKDEDLEILVAFFTMILEYGHG
jgi:hypothetical protein